MEEERTGAGGRRWAVKGQIRGSDLKPVTAILTPLVLYFLHMELLENP